MTVLSLVCWIGLGYLTYISYGLDLLALWQAIFSDADAGVAFLTIDYILIQIGLIFGYFERSLEGELKKTKQL